MAKFLQNNVAIETALEGCPDLTAGRAIFLPAGYPGRACHELRDESGNPIDLLRNLSMLHVDEEEPDDSGTTTTAAPGSPHKIYVANTMCAGVPIVANLCISADDPTRVCFDIPAQVTANPGIYTAEMMIVDGSGRPYLSDSTLISIESSLYLRHTQPGQNAPGPVTLGQVRIQMRDFAGLNTYWQNVEFSDAEIVHSLLEPIRCFNETMPHARHYTPSDFPFRHNWLQATCACLLRISSTSYMRNSRKIVYGDGKTSDDRDKYATYAQMAEAKWREYQMFCTEQQVRANWLGVSRHGGYFQS